METDAFTAVLLTKDPALKERILGFWPEEEVLWFVYDDENEAIQHVMTILPNLMVCDMHVGSLDGLEIIGMVKGENVYRKVPALICLNAQEFEEHKEIGDVEVDEFFVLPGSDEEFKARIMLTLRRSNRNMDANPLTRLPGNTSILRNMENRINRKDFFAMGYCDLDFFKSFNDKYGFARGDEVLMMAARIVLNSVRNVSPSDYFVGHIGGDDFIFIVPPQYADEVCKGIIAAFDDIIPQFYDPEDRINGGIVTEDRQGITRKFPIMSLSIAVVVNKNGWLTHVGQAAQVASNIKKKVKETITSSYIIDRRSYPPA